MCEVVYFGGRGWLVVCVKLCTLGGGVGSVCEVVYFGGRGW